jgi:hypothetical protein
MPRSSQFAVRSSSIDFDNVLGVTQIEAARVEQESQHILPTMLGAGGRTDVNRKRQ